MKVSELIKFLENTNSKELEIKIHIDYSNWNRNLEYQGVEEIYPGQIYIHNDVVYIKI